MFKEPAIYYEDTLDKAGYISKLDHHALSASKQENKKAKIANGTFSVYNVITFNPPFSKSITTRIVQSFLHLIDTLSQKIIPLTKSSTEMKLK